MTQGPQVPAGWYPDPTNSKTIRYWDGSGWTGLTATPSQTSLEDQTTTRTTPPAMPDPVVHERKAPGWAKAAIAALALVLTGLIALAIVREPEFGDQPRDEQEVVELIQEAREEYEGADHDLQRDAALRDRDAGICRVLHDPDPERDGRVENWTGKVFEIESTHDGEGVLGINIEPMTQVTTRNNALSGDDTLIQPGTQLLEQVTELEIGQVVTFSGRFIADEDGPCFSNPRFTQGQRIARPLMLFQFDTVEGE
jgi:hypothetical protein